MKRIVAVGPVLLIALVLPATAQQETGITPRILQELEGSFESDEHFRSVQNALAQFDGNKIASNWEKMISIDDHFSNRLKDQKITDQKSSGRCWMFSSLNTLRPVAVKKLNCKEFEFSQNYLFFYDKLEKANMFLEAVIKLRDRPVSDRTVEFLLRAPVQDGGNWLGFIELVKKYGVVPKDITPETYSSSNSGTVNHVLGLKLKQYAMKLRDSKNAGHLDGLKVQALKDVYKILGMNFGIPPRKFKWRYETKNDSLTEFTTYTPREFYREVVDQVLDDYCPFYSIPTLPFGKKYEIDLDKAVYDRPNMYFVNVPLETLKELAKKALLDNQPVWFGCDVGQESMGDNGLMAPEIRDYSALYGMDFDLSRKELFETYSSIPTHNMVFTGIDIVDGKIQKWLVENSWGEKAGKKGYSSMTDAWFDKYVQVLAVHKKYVPKDVLALFDTKADILPPWDPMFHLLNGE